MPSIDDLLKKGVNHYSYYRPEQPAEEEKGDMRRGFDKAMLQVPQTFGGAAALVGDAVGSDGLKDYGLEIYRRRTQQIEDLTRPSDSFSSVLEGEGNPIDFLQSGAGYVGGQVLTSLGTAGVGGFIGRQLALQGAKKAIAAGVAKEVAQQGVRRGAIAGATTAAFGGNLVQEAGSIYPEALDTAEAEGRLAPDGGLTGGDLVRVGGSAVAAAGVDTAMDAVMAGRVLKGARKPGESMLRAGAREVPGAMAREAVTEGIQTGIERFGAQKDLTTADAVRDYVDSMALGALGGGMGGAATVARPAPKLDDTGPMSRAANVVLEDQHNAVVPESEPGRLYDLPDGSKGDEKAVMAHIAMMPDPDQREQQRRQIMGLDPETGKRVLTDEESQQKIADFSSRKPPLPLDVAETYVEAARKQGIAPLAVVPHASGGGFTVVPDEWLSLNQRANAIGAVREYMEAAKASQRPPKPTPEQTAERTTKELEEQGHFGLILNANGNPFRAQVAANLKARQLGEGHFVVEVPGGWAVAPAPKQEEVADAELDAAGSGTDGGIDRGIGGVRADDTGGMGPGDQQPVDAAGVVQPGPAAVAGDAGRGNGDDALSAPAEGGDPTTLTPAAPATEAVSPVNPPPSPNLREEDNGGQTSTQQGEPEQAAPVEKAPRLDHGVLNVPLAKRGDIDAQIDKYKAGKAAEEKSRIKTARAKHKEIKETAKAQLDEHLPAILEQHSPRFGKAHLQKTMKEMASLEPAKFIKFVGKFQKEEAERQSAALSAKNEKEALDYNLPKNTIAGGEKEIGELHDAVRDGDIPANLKRSVRFAVVSDEVAARIKQATGLDVAGYKHAIDSFAIRHAYEKHGDAKREAKRGQEAIGKDDILRIPDIVSSPDDVRAVGESSAGVTLIQYAKSYDSTTYYVEEVRTKRGELMAKTLWKARTAMPDAAPEAAPPALTSETFSRNRPQSGDSVPPSSGQGKPSDGEPGSDQDLPPDSDAPTQGRGQNAPQISPLDQSVLVDIASGKDLSDVLTRIAAESADPGQKEVAERLLAAKLKTTVEFGNAQGAQFAVKGISAANFAAGYKPRADAILLFKPQSAALSVLHEALHAATFKALRAGGIAARQMQALYEHVAKSRLLNGLYEMENIDEFVVGAFTNPQVQDLLREIPAAADGASRFANAWAKFVSIVRGILGLKNDTALEQILRVGDALMTENEAIRSAEAAANGEQVLGRAIGDTIKNLTVSDVKHRAGNKLADYRNLALQALGRRQLVDIYAGDFKPENGESILQQYSDLVQRMDADKNESGAEADGVADRWSKLKDEKPLADVMHDATLAQIDPDKQFAAGDDRAQYDALKARFAALSPDAQQVYRDARDMYAAHYKKVSDEIKARITRAMPDNATRATMLKKMDAEFFKSIKGVYFPLGRYGDYLVTVKDAAGNTLSVSSAETLNEAEATRKALQQQFPDQVVSKVLKRKEFNAARDSVSRGFLKQLFGVFDQYDVGDEMQEMVNQLYLSSMPDLSWAKHGIHRKGTPGFSQDARRAFAKNMFHGARYLAKLKYSDRMTDKLDEMQKHVDSKATDPDYDSVKGQHVVDEMLKRHDAYLNPQTSNLSTTLTSIGYLFYMGLSPASAAVNLTGTPLMAFPILGGKYGFAKAGAALLSASKLIAKGKNDLSKVLTGDRLAAYQEAVNAGVIDVTMAHDLAGIAAGNDQQLGGKMRQAMKWAGWMFHHVERYNRGATLLASYDLARAQGKSHEEAYKAAVDDVYASQFDYSSGNRPRIMQGNVARVVLLFRQYSQNMIYTLTRNAIKAAKGDKVAQRTLAGLLVSHALGAGVLGLPVVGLLLSAASAIGSDDDEPWDAKIALRNYTADMIGQKPAEVLMHGLSRLTPWDLSGRIGLDKLLLPDIQEGLEGQRAAEAWAMAALGPVAGIGAGVAKGMADIGKGEYQRGLENMMPVALRNPIKALRFAQEGVQDKTGVAILDETTPLEEIGQALGFSPSRSREAFEGKAAIYSADKALQARRQSLMTQYAQARQAGDDEGAKEIREDINAFNLKNPSRRISGQNLVASLRMRNKRIEQAEQGIYLPKKRREVMEAGQFAAAEG